LSASSGWTSYGPLGPSQDEAPEEHDDRLRVSDVGKLARRARRRVVRAARADDRVTFAKMLREHFGVDPHQVNVVQENWPAYDHVNVQAGLDAWLAEQGRTHDVVGLLNMRHRDLGLAELMRAGNDKDPYTHGVTPGNVSYVNLPTGPEGEVRPCVECGLYLVTDGDDPVAMLFRSGDDLRGRPQTTLEIAATRPERGAEIASEVRRLAVEHNVYRGHVVSFDHDMFGERGTVLSFHSRPTMSLADLILPEETISAVSRQVVGVARHRKRLLAAGQHLKRGLLLYGPPGVGKTHTVRYLMSQLTEVTIVQLSGSSLGNIGAACSVARTLQPAMIVVEDVDLIAEERMMHPGQHPLLFELLNEMDGLAEDADVVFLLTTNRPDVLEPALAQRPGRVDQAVALGLPDEDGRRQLFALYRGALEVDESRLDALLARTGGVTASFLKELLRRAAVMAAESAGDSDGSQSDGSQSDGSQSDGSQPLSVSADQLDAALDDLLETRNSMTRVLLGGEEPSTARASRAKRGKSRGARSGTAPEPGIFPRPGLAPDAIFTEE
jgi:hypothetical protein